MTPYGSDRVRVDGERIVLSSRLPKGWKARVAKTNTSAEFPGTAVLWDEQYFEVIAAEPLPHGVRYTLEPWPEHHAMRVTARYDADSEAALVAGWRAALGRERKRKTAGTLALLTGHLPAIVQERIGSELGVLASRMTMVSLLSELALLFLLIGYMVTEKMALGPIPAWAIVVASFLFFETALRFLVVWTQHRPAGSSLGVIAYIVYWLVSGRREDESPFARLQGHAAPITATPEERVHSDALMLREPFATLLPVADQGRLRERYGYDYQRLSAPVAAFVLTFAMLGVITAYSNRQIIPGLVALFVAGEQLVRLGAFRRGPAASVLGFLVRPLLRKLL
jgi:hypothetical protein